MIKNVPLSFVVYVLILFILLLACNNKEPRQPVVAVKTDSLSKHDASVKGSFSDQRTLILDSSHIKKILSSFPLLGKYASDVKQFYNYRKNSYAWYETSGLIEEAAHLYTHLNNLQEEGVLEQAPYVKNLDSLINDPVVTTKPDSVLEILLTAEYLFYADRVWNGISENQTSKLEWYIPRKKLDLPYITDSLIRDDSAPLFSDNYSNQQYNLLKTSLKKYRQLEITADWKPIDAKNKFKLNDHSPDIVLIRKKLFELGDLNQNTGSDIFDDSLQSAIKSFQIRYGMKTDGIIGTTFLRYLNTPIQEYIRKIIVNMERTRWVPLDLKSHYLLINIPSFTLYAYDNNHLDFSMNVVVGKDVHKTVLFSRRYKVHCI